MKTIAFGILSMCIAGAAFAQVGVQGHVRKDGTYVQPYVRSAPDTDRTNNYSAKGNMNPYTGQQGTVDPYRPLPQPAYQPSPQPQQRRCAYGQVSC